MSAINYHTTKFSKSADPSLEVNNWKDCRYFRKLRWLVYLGNFSELKQSDLPTFTLKYPSSPVLSFHLFQSLACRDKCSLLIWTQHLFLSFLFHWHIKPYLWWGPKENHHRILRGLDKSPNCKVQYNLDCNAYHLGLGICMRLLNKLGKIKISYFNYKLKNLD